MDVISKKSSKQKRVPEFLDSWLLPKPYQKILAIGFESEDIPRVYCPTVPHFRNIPSPTHIDDFLAQNSPDNQSYQQWKQLVSSIDFKTKGETIFIQPIGDFKNTFSSAPDLDAIQEYISAYFFPMKVVCLPSVDISMKSNKYFIEKISENVSEQLKMRRCHPYFEETTKIDHKQFSVNEILRFLIKIKPSDAACLIAVTMEDLFQGTTDEFVVGMAGSCQVGVFSFCRYLPTFPDYKKNLTKKEKVIFLSRCCKVAVHEIGHNFAIMHCSYYACCMNGSGHLLEDYSQPIHLCPIDLRKVVTYAKCKNPIERYELLAKFYSKYGMKDEEKWVMERLAWVNENKDNKENEINGEKTERITRQTRQAAQTAVPRSDINKRKNSNTGQESHKKKKS